MQFLFAWELGGGLGHAVPLAQVAKPLVAQGHQVDFVLKDLSNLPAAFGELRHSPHVRFWQAPIWLDELRGLPDSASFAELLFHAGFLDPARLSGLVKAWRSLFDAIRPDFMLVDYAPTAMLAARGKPFRRGVIGHGFFIPPHEYPMPAFREWDAVDRQRLLVSEERALTTTNVVLEGLGQAPLKALHELMDADESFLLTWRELDHYSARAAQSDARYWGALQSTEHCNAPVWPEGSGPKLFAYLKADYRPTMAILQLLRSGPWRTLAYVPGLSLAAVAQLTSEHLRLSMAPVDLAQASKEVDVVVCNGNTGTCGSVLVQGKPLLLLPMQAEQMLFSLRIQQSGAGVVLHEAEATSKLVRTLKRLQREPTFAAAAQGFAQRYGEGGSLPQGDVALAIAQRCEALAVAPASG